MAARKTERKSSKKKPVYKRILLKLSGEAMQGPQGYGVHGETLQAIARELKEVLQLGVEIAVVVGGGNIFRGGRQRGFEIDRTRTEQALPAWVPLPVAEWVLGRARRPA